MTRRTLILDRTPARELLVARIDEACGRLADLGYTPKAIYLTAADAKACGLGKLHGARDPGDPPRCRGLPIYGIKGAGGNKMYAKGGPSTSFKPIAADRALVFAEAGVTRPTARATIARATTPDREGEI